MTAPALSALKPTHRLSPVLARPAITISSSRPLFATSTICRISSSASYCSCQAFGGCPPASSSSGSSEIRRRQFVEICERNLMSTMGRKQLAADGPLMAKGGRSSGMSSRAASASNRPATEGRNMRHPAPAVFAINREAPRAEPSRKSPAGPLHVISSAIVPPERLAAPLNCVRLSWLDSRRSTIGWRIDFQSEPTPVMI